MKKIFETIGILSLFVFSYIYTSKVASLFLENDSLMVSINDYKDKNDFNCKEGYITEEGIILGINGLIVDENKSYSNMKGGSFNKDLLIYSKDKCLINKENNLDKYIIKGNSSKKSVSLLIVINNENMQEILNFLDTKNVEVSLVINNLNNIDSNSINALSKYSLLYSGTDKAQLKKMLNVNKNIFCISINEDNLNMCMEEKVNTIKTNKIYNKNLYSNVRKTLESGDIIVLNNPKEMLTDLDAIINFISAKGLKIVGIFDLLE